MALLGFAIAIWASVCGIGGGLFAVPLLHYVLRLSLRESIATSLVLVFATTTAASVAEVVRSDAALHLPTVITLVVASVVGARIGFALALAIDTRRLKALFVVVLLLVAAKVLSTPVGGGGEPIALFENLGYERRDYVWIALTGLAAGIVAPLLGVGGGLVALPALFLGISPLGYLGARAASLMMSMVNAWISILLYWRTGAVCWPIARPFAGGALFGAVLGVWVVHHPGLVAVARGLLAATLVFVAFRFALDLRRPRQAAQA